MGIRYSEFRGKVAFITGASSGIGAEFARQLHARGCFVILTARRAERLATMVEEFNSIRAGSAEFWAGDLRRSQDLEDIATRAASRDIDIFINNAGVGSFGFLEAIPFEYEQAIVSLNVVATTRLAHAVIPRMKNRRSGMYVSVSSVAGFEPLPFMATYSASKAFNLFQTLALREELNDFNVGALTVCPGPTDTEFFGMSKFSGSTLQFKRYSVATIVKESLSAMESGRAFVVPGFKAKLATFAVRCLPLTLSTKVSKWYLKRAL